MQTFAQLRKMKTQLGEVVEYHLPTDDGDVSINEYVGSSFTIKFLGKINCVACDKVISKTYGGGYCYDCLQSLPECDMCMVKPELCHYERGTCRNPAWGEAHCFDSHSVYMARSSGVKVGITREKPTAIRWMDQGAVEAMVIAEVPDRKTSGLIEVALAEHIPDKTDFRKMLRGETSSENLKELFENIKKYVPKHLQQYLIENPDPVSIKYPLPTPPDKIKVSKLDTSPEVGGVLKGVKGQYLVFEESVFNMRAHSGYRVEITGEVNENQSDEEDEDEEEEMSLFDFMG